jgi:hypothetical protein
MNHEDLWSEGLELEEPEMRGWAVYSGCEGEVANFRGFFPSRDDAEAFASAKYGPAGKRMSSGQVSVRGESCGSLDTLLASGSHGYPYRTFAMFAEFRGNGPRHGDRIGRGCVVALTGGSRPRRRTSPGQDSRTLRGLREAPIRRAQGFRALGDLACALE